MIKVSDKIYRGPRPPSLQWLEEQGFGCVIDLQSGTYEAVTDDQYEREKLDPNRRLAIFDFNLSNIFPPQRNQVSYIITLLMRLQEAKINMQYVDSFGNTVGSKEIENKKIYIHCLRGKDRTGFVCAAFKMRYMCTSYESAVKEMDSLGFNNLFYWWWKFFLKRNHGY